MSDFIYSKDAYDGVKNYLQKLRTMTRGNIEFEIRIGTFTGTRFMPGLSRSVFEAAARAMGISSFEKVRVIRYQNGVRRLSTPNGDILETIQKRKTSVYDYDFLMGEYNIRLSAKEEVPYTLSVDDLRVEQSFIREQASIVQNNVSYDFRRYDNHHEIEIEFQQLASISVSTLLSSFEQIFRHISSFHGAISIREKQLVLSENKRYSIRVKRPVNLKKDISLDGMSVLPKVDGYRYMLQTFPFGTVLVRDFTVILLTFTGRDELSIVDGEYVEESHTFYGFDCLFENNQDVRDKPFSERYERMQSILEGMPYISVESMPMYTNLIDGLIQISKLPLKLDGVIFTPNGRYAQQNYKYKPASMLTIDFKVMKEGETCRIYAGNEQFVGDSVHPFQGTVRCNDLKHDTVYEFKWNANENTFVAIRERTDKKYPNAMPVALSVWSDIHDPYPVLELLRTIDPVNKRDVSSIYSMFGETHKTNRVYEIQDEKRIPIMDVSDFTWGEDEEIKTVEIDGISYFMTREYMLMIRGREPISLAEFLVSDTPKSPSVEVSNHDRMLGDDEIVMFDTSYGPLVRHGAVADGSCFFHSMMNAANEEYRNMSSKNKRRFIKEERSRVASSLSKSDLKKIGGGVLVHLKFQDYLSYYIERKERPSKFPSNMQVYEKRYPELFKIFMSFITDDLVQRIDAVSYEIFERVYLPALNLETGGMNEKCKNVIEENRAILVDQYKQFLKLFYLCIYNRLYKEYVEELEDTSTFVDYSMIEYLMNYYNVDVYFVEYDSKKVYQIGDCSLYKKRKSVVILHYSGIHFETIGRELGDDEIQYIFEPTDPLIQQLYNEICV